MSSPRRLIRPFQTGSAASASAGNRTAIRSTATTALGAALARLEGRVAVERMAVRFPALALAAEPVWNGRINLRGLDTLPVTVR